MRTLFIYISKQALSLAMKDTAQSKSPKYGFQESQKDGKQIGSAKDKNRFNITHYDLEGYNEFTTVGQRSRYWTLIIQNDCMPKQLN